MLRKKIKKLINIIKVRKMKMSKRGVYIQDKELSQSDFKVGSHYRYVIDVNSKKIVILSSDNESDNTVSKRKVKDDEFKSVIDIRDKEALKVFEGADYLQCTIVEDRVIVEGFKNADTSTNTSLIEKASYLINRATKKVVSITDLLKVRKIAEVVMSKQTLQKAVGGYEQISLNFDEMFSNISKDYSFKNPGTVKNNLKNLEIPLKVISLFSGAGLLDKGFVNAGFDVIWANEISKDACLTYSKNIGTHIVNADITELDLEKTPKAPFLIGGSPCILYTNSNRYTNINKKLQEAERILDIPANILLRKYIESVKINDECVVFVHENVGQLNTIGDGKLLEEIREELPDFEITTSILNAADYGPQERKRSIIIGSKLGKIEIPRPIVHAYTNVRDAFKGLNDSIPNQKDFSKPKPLTLERMKYVGQGENVYAIPEEIRPSGLHSDYFKRLEWDKPSITIVNPRKSMILHPEENRILSVRECSRLQGLDDDFIFYGSLGSKQQQVCNGVQVNLAYAIAMKIKEYVAEYLASKHQQIALSI